MFAKKDDHGDGLLHIDLTGPAGNAFVILGHASRFAKKFGDDWLAIQADMTSGDYDHLLEVFEEHYGDYVMMYI